MTELENKSQELSRLLQYTLADMKLHSDRCWPDRFPEHHVDCGEDDFLVCLTADPNEECWPFEISEASEFLARFVNENLNPSEKMNAQAVRLFSDEDGLNLLIRGGYAEADDA